jgi:hypothetical protein
MLHKHTLDVLIVSRLGYPAPPPASCQKCEFGQVATGAFCRIFPPTKRATIDKNIISY